MPKRSKVILDNNDNIHRSRLIKSITALTDDTLYTCETPSGVWGSVAIVKSGSLTFDSSKLDLEFDVPFDDDLESNEGEIVIYNLSVNTDKMLKARTGKNITIVAGYGKDTGLLFEGNIAKVNIERSGADKVTTIKVVSKISNNPTVNLSFSSGTKYSKILRSLLSIAEDEGMVLAKFVIHKDSSCENDVTIDEPLTEALKTYSEACGVSTFVNNGKIYSCKLNDVDNASEFNVNVDTGMIGSPSEFTEEVKRGNETDIINGYEVDMLLQHRLTAGSKINLYALSDNALTRSRKILYVKSGSHKFNQSECVTTIKAVEVKAG